MPKSTRWMIKAGFFYLAAGVILAGMNDILPGFSGFPLLAVYWHMIVMGWITQVIMGVSIWMFPGRRRGKGIKESVLPWLVLGLLNSGLILRFAFEPFAADAGGSRPVEYGLILSALMQTASVAVYLAEMWPRVQLKKVRR